MPDENNDLVYKPDEQIEANAAPDLTAESDSLDNNTDVEARSKFRRFIDFVKKHKISLSIITGVIILLIGVFIFIPVINVGKTSLVNVGTIIKLEKDQAAKLKVRDVTVKIVSFTNDVCPIGKKCFGSNKQAVEYMLTENGKGFANGSETPPVGSDYKIETISSDYKTYAEIKIVKQK